MNPRDKANTALDEYGHEQYRLGMETGLQVAERIRAWLTQEPDTVRQREVRKWADAAIKKARDKVSNR
ncbi:MAG: hypothetical protein U9Q07_04065 [Planctomycetota bacterium]|nr:hypothetical protein [Planctomycetota bacterium]